jgi:hypothetical protein
MTPEQINPIIEQERKNGETEINKLRASFYNAIYEESDLPVYFMSLFSKSLFNLAPMSDNISSKGLVNWLKKDNKELNFGEVMKMTEIIASVPRNRIFKDMDEANEKLEVIEMIMFDLREKNNVFTHEIEKKSEDLKRVLHKRKFELQNQPGKVKLQKLKKTRNLSIAQ